VIWYNLVFIGQANQGSRKSNINVIWRKGKKKKNKKTKKQKNQKNQKEVASRDFSLFEGLFCFTPEA